MNKFITKRVAFLIAATLVLVLAGALVYSLGRGLQSKEKLGDATSIQGNVAKADYCIYHVTKDLRFKTMEEFEAQFLYEYPQIYFPYATSKEEVINRALYDGFVDFIRDGFEGYPKFSPEVHYQSERYCSVLTSLRRINDYTGEEMENGWLDIVHTVDIEKGRILRLNDILIVNDELIEKIYSGEIVSGMVLSSGSEFLDEQTVSRIQDRGKQKLRDALNSCSYDYTMENYITKSSFYLTDGKINICTPDTFYLYQPYNFGLNLDDIEEYLKVDKW